MDRKLLEKYFTGGNCHPDELHRIEEYLQQPDQLLQEFLLEEWKKAGGLVNMNRKEKTLEQILAVTGQLPVRETPALALRKKQWKPYWAAAIITGLLLLSSIIYNNSRNISSVAATNKSWKTFQNTSTKVQLVTLPEGSKVWLNSRTAISYPSDYESGGNRQIRLSGEAYFDVAKDARRPFIVYTDSLQTMVLGTSFSIRAWPRTSSIQVALVKGSVRVSGFNDAVKETLVPGDLLSFTSTNRKLTKTTDGVRPDMYEWTTGKIVLSNTPVAEALEQLQQLYGVTIHYNAGDMRNRKLTGKFKRESIDTVLQNLLFAADMKYSKKDSTYFITIQ